MCDDCKNDLLDPVVAVEQVKALRRVLAEASYASRACSRTWAEIERIAWPEIWTRDDGLPWVAVVGGEPVRFGPPPLAAGVAGAGAGG